MSENIIDEIEKVREEIYNCFNKWDARVEAGQQPVPIQDLDYWNMKLSKAVRGLKQ